MLLNAVSGKPSGLVIKLQAPAPVAGGLAPSVTVVPQKFWSGPAADAVGVWSNSIKTLSVLAVHEPLLIVHCNSYVTPAVPLNWEVGLVAFTKLPPPPLTMLQDPVPVTATFPARVVLVPHTALTPVWSPPAAATVGDWSNLICTLSPLDAHTPLLMVHLNT